MEISERCRCDNCGDVPEKSWHICSVCDAFMCRDCWFDFEQSGIHKCTFPNNGTYVCRFCNKEQPLNGQLHDCQDYNTLLKFYHWTPHKPSNPRLSKKMKKALRRKFHTGWRSILEEWNVFGRDERQIWYNNFHHHHNS